MWPLMVWGCRAPDLSQFVVNSLKHSSEMVVFEAAKCICSLKTASAKDLTPAILGVPPGTAWSEESQTRGTTQMDWFAGLGFFCSFIDDAK
jgi:hypothetical protein